MPGNAFAAVELIETHLNLATDFSELGGPEAILIFEEPQSFADDFAGRLVTTALHLSRNQLFKFRRERDVHDSFQ